MPSAHRARYWSEPHGAGLTGTRRKDELRRRTRRELRFQVQAEDAVRPIPPRGLCGPNLATRQLHLHRGAVVLKGQEPVGELEALREPLQASRKRQPAISLVLVLHLERVGQHVATHARRTHALSVVVAAPTIATAPCV